MLDLNRTERHALLVGTALVLLGGAVRVGLAPGPATFGWREGGGETTGRGVHEAGRPAARAGDSAALPGVRAAVGRNVRRAGRAATPLSPGETIDLDSAPVWELERLPGVGPATARRIVTERERSGGFSRPEDLERVKGLGPARLRRILPYVVAHSRAYYERDGPARARRRDASRGPDRAADSAPTRERAPLVEVNRASEEELARLPGVGPSIARRIVLMRERDGPFRRVEDLRRVPGIGPARFDLIRERVRVP